jgi:hypothetical protein
MKYFGILTFGLLVFLLVSCGGVAQTADEYRMGLKNAKGFTARYTTVDSYEVDRSFTEVSKTFQKNGERCLKKTIKRTSSTPGRYGPEVHTSITHYTPTVIVTDKRAELHLQVRHEGEVEVVKVPEAGVYLLVADAYPAGKKKTRMEMYYGTVGNEAIIKTIKGWADGTNKGCPDLTK